MATNANPTKYKFILLLAAGWSRVGVTKGSFGTEAGAIGITLLSTGAYGILGAGDGSGM